MRSEGGVLPGTSSERWPRSSRPTGYRNSATSDAKLVVRGSRLGPIPPPPRPPTEFPHGGDAGGTLGIDRAKVDIKSGRTTTVSPRLSTGPWRGDPRRSRVALSRPVLIVGCAEPGPNLNFVRRPSPWPSPPVPGGWPSATVLPRPEGHAPSITGCFDEILQAAERAKLAGSCFERRAPPPQTARAPGSTTKPGPPVVAGPGRLSVYKITTKGHGGTCPRPGRSANSAGPRLSP